MANLRVAENTSVYNSALQQRNKQNNAAARGTSSGSNGSAESVDKWVPLATAQQNLQEAQGIGAYIRDYAAANLGAAMPVVGGQNSADAGKWPTVSDEDGAGSGGGGGGGGYYRGSSAPAKPAYTAATLPAASSQEAYINAMYDANAQKQKAALEAQYAANVGALDQQAAKIPGQYDAAANQAAAQAAINRANFNEQAAATGLNTGSAGQAALAQNNALLGEISAIRRAQSEAQMDVEAQRASLMQQYQAAIKEAIANNEADRAAALYNEAKRVDESLVSTAVNQATENYRAWQAMYG